MNGKLIDISGKKIYNQSSYVKRIIVIIALAIVAIMIFLQLINIIFANLSVKKLTQYVEDGELNKIALVSYDRDQLMYDEYAAILDGTIDDPVNKKKNEILSEIYKQNIIDSEFVFPLFFSTEVTLEIKSIDMEKVLTELLEDVTENTTQEEFSEMFIQKITTAKQDKLSKVTLPMKLTTNGWVIDTENNKFRDSISGGLYTSYATMYESTRSKVYSELEQYMANNSSVEEANQD